ncbi:MAG TPA: sigma-70 family RNA polymerase sigma factor [Gammaproteobacteria bacterium]|nr:sigma-70 family RNA polymerase sigma factor [Gammaproteobacteria bacterium]
MDVPADQDLMLRFRDGHTAAFGELYDRHRGPLYRYFARQTTRASVDDLFQETWMRVIRAKDDYRPDPSFRAYLYRIAHNVLVDHYRREGHASLPQASDDIDPIDPAIGPDGQYERAELRAAFAAALERLPAEQREAFLLHEEAGLTLEQIAAVVGAGRETVKSRLRYAVARLRETLGARYRAMEELR